MGIVGRVLPRAAAAAGTCECRQDLSLVTEALALDMGLYSIPGFAASSMADDAGLLPQLPQLPAPPLCSAGSTPTGSSHAAAAAAAAKAAGGNPHAIQHEPGNAKQQGAAEAAAGAVSGAAVGAAAGAVVAAVGPCAPEQSAAGITGARAAAPTTQSRLGSLRLYQVLSPRLVERAHLFGNKLALRDGTTCHDLPFFCAPAAASVPTLDPLRQQLAAGQSTTPGDGRGGASGGSAVTALLRHRQRLLPPGSTPAAGVAASQAALDASAATLLGTDAAGNNAAAAAGVSGGAAPDASGSSTAASGSGLWRRRQARQHQHQHQQGSMLLTDTCEGTDAGSADPSLPKDVQQSCLHIAPSAGLGVAAASGRPLQADDSAVTFVFCSVINPRAKLSMEPGQAKLTGQLSGIVSRVLRQCLLALSQPASSSSSSSSSSSPGGPPVPGQAAGGRVLTAAGYLCREMQGDLKYILAFNSPRCVVVCHVFAARGLRAAAARPGVVPAGAGGHAVAGLASGPVRQAACQRTSQPFGASQHSGAARCCSSRCCCYRCWCWCWC
ncbi:hypothetical protein COO60DRAFT_706093 [Scenedesmus sp. NREL 46B-D3]|nr:hypothetical protein COO60DRAFT_706093 [Scenedesmus sp. NREL 46B-D3]